MRYIVLDTNCLLACISILKEQIDFDNVMVSAFHAKPLYDELKVIFHPDRFINEEKNAMATEIFQSITENKENYKILLELKERAYKELINNK